MIDACIHIIHISIKTWRKISWLWKFPSLLFLINTQFQKISVSFSSHLDTPNILHTHEIMQWTLFCSWFHFLSILFEKFMLLHELNSFSFLSIIIQLYEYIRIIYLFFSYKHLSCFYFGTIMSKSVMNISNIVCVKIYSNFSWVNS